MKLLINLSTQKRGGGQNVALNFLASLQPCRHPTIEFHFVVAKGSAVANEVARLGLNHITVSQTPALRILQELFTVSAYMLRHSIDIVYTYFGHGLFLAGRPQVVGSATSNIYFPEVDFWADYKGWSKFRKLAIDRYRLWGARSAAGVIFENEALEHRYKKLCSSTKPTVTIHPSINTEANATAPWTLPSFQESSNPITGLFLCGWQPNKNVLAIPAIAAEARKQGFNLQIVLTAQPDGSSLHRQFVQMLKEHDVEGQVAIAGGVRKEQLGDLYSKVDVVFLLSKLESFSNNIIEAWNYRRPLVVADEPWSRAICGDSALYVDRQDPKGIVTAVQAMFMNQPAKEQILLKATNRLKDYPNIEEKTRQELEFVERVFTSSRPCSR
jgi:glycosyltransferase involved in cell wall biosynthesis